jgi:hypothetical protein
MALPEGSAARLRTVAAAVEAAEQDLAERRARAETASPKGFKNVPSGETGTGAFAHQRAPAGFLPCLIGNAAGTVGVAELHGARDRAGSARLGQKRASVPLRRHRHRRQSPSRSTNR